jgi:aminocarboxymuconate-semialdehyde decarboxylase
MYGTDYPCWDPATCLQLIEEIGLSEADQRKLFVDNVREVFRLPSAPAASDARQREGAAAY